MSWINEPKAWRQGAGALAFMFAFPMTPIHGARAQEAPVVYNGHARAQGVAFEIGATPFPFSGRMHFTHTYVCVGRSTTFAGRKQCFGFYPQNEGITAVFPLPGVIRNENGERRFEASTLFKTRISPATRKRVLKAVESFDTSYFQLNGFNCIDFTDALARAAFLSTPSRAWWQTPENYVRELSQLNNSHSKMTRIEKSTPSPSDLTRTRGPLKQRHAARQEALINPHSNQLIDSIVSKKDISQKSGSTLRGATSTEGP